jgi:SAM-dependent methyltransferase
MHKSVQRYCEAVRRRFPDHFTSVSALDCGSLDINGNNRYLFNNSRYIGIDIAHGPNVQIVTRVHEFHPADGKLYDTIISTEMLEHDANFAQSLYRMYNLLKPGGLLLITAAGQGRKEHGTTASSPKSSPCTNDYYHNILPEDIVMNLPLQWFSQWSIDYLPHDIRFFGIKSEILALSEAEVSNPKSEIF